MANNKKKGSSIFGFIKNLIFVVPNLFSLLTYVVTIAGYETRLALRSLIVILILAFVVGALVTTTWMGVLAMVYIYLVSIHWTPLASIAIVLLVNLVMLLIFAIIILKQRKNLSFIATRKQLGLISNFYKS
jgi:hypothetical protein